MEANLRDADLGYANLRTAYLGYANLTRANLFGADLQDVPIFFFGTDLTDADMNLTNLSESLFDCTSLKTINFAVNANQIHIVEIINGSPTEVSSCQ